MSGSRYKASRFAWQYLKLVRMQINPFHLVTQSPVGLNISMLSGILVLFLVKWFHRKTFYLNFYGFYLIEPQTFLPFILICLCMLVIEIFC